MCNFIVLAWLVVYICSGKSNMIGKFCNATSLDFLASGIELNCSEANINITAKQLVTYTCMLTGTGSSETPIHVKVNGISPTTPNQSLWEMIYSDSFGYVKLLENGLNISVTIIGYHVTVGMVKLVFFAKNGDMPSINHTTITYIQGMSHFTV